VDEVIAADDLGVGIREDGERVAGLAGQVGRGGGRVDADGDRADAQPFELGETLLNTP
jgi:hypothetical protein